MMNLTIDQFDLPAADKLELGGQVGPQQAEHAW